LSDPYILLRYGRNFTYDAYDDFMTEEAKRKLILLVDDDPSVIDAVSGFLRESSFDVIAETDSEKAVRLARHMLVDLLILDLQMPKLDGVELLKQLRKQQPHLKAIILTGQLPQYEDRLKGVKIDRIIAKPPSTDKLLKAVADLTEKIAFEPDFDQEKSVTPKAKILIVDDEIEYCEIVSDFFRSYPKALFEVEYALSGLEAIEKASFMEPDFVLLDWKMPMMSGTELFGKLQAIEDWAAKQYFIISASQVPASEMKLLPPDTPFFMKPFDLEKVADLLYKRCLDLGLVENRID